MEFNRELKLHIVLLFPNFYYFNFDSFGRTVLNSDCSKHNNVCLYFTLKL